MSLGSSRSILVLLILVAAPLLAATPVTAYQTYSSNRTTGNCADCHGGFRATTYVSKVDGATWPSSLHDTHRNTMLGGDCDACHGTSTYPVNLGSSLGGSGLSPWGCSGCHGRSQDGTVAGTSQGFGAGLRQHHYRKGVTGCVSCHTDSNPASKTPVAENVKPPYYASPGTGHPAMPTDPCNPSPTYVENFAGTTLGLDNDGNGLFDTADPACGASTPGQTASGSPMIITAFDKATGNLALSYGIACAATDNNVEYGPISSLPSYGYTGQSCAVGNTGTATVSVPDGSYFLIVAHNATVEGSYGTKVQGGVATERPTNTTAGACRVTQDLSKRCN